MRIGWANSYSPEAIEKAVDSLNHKPSRLPNQYPDRASVLPGNLFPADGTLRMAENGHREQANDLQGTKAGIRNGATYSCFVCGDSTSHREAPARKLVLFEPFADLAANRR